MAKAGRKPLDPKIVRLRSVRKGTIIPKVGLNEHIRCPQTLTGRARNTWKMLIPELKKMNNLAPIDRYLLQMFCEAYAEYEEMKALIQSPIVSTKNGNIIQHPAVQVRNAAYKRMVQIAKEFGLSSASRQALGITFNQKSKSEKSRFFEGRKSGA